MKAIFLDRDGTLSEDVGYPKTWDDFKPFPWTVTALGLILQKGYRLFLITNQSGIARGYFSLEEAQSLNQKILDYFAGHKVPFTDYRMCPHHQNGVLSEFSIDCACRKPKPGMILDMASIHHIDLAGSFTVGDKPSDGAAGQAAGTEGVLLTGVGGPNKKFSDSTEQIRRDLLSEVGGIAHQSTLKEFATLADFAEWLPVAH